MSREENLEHEYKFDVAESFELPDLRSIGGAVEELAGQRFVTTYFDTADFSLWARRMTLRHRAERAGGFEGVGEGGGKGGGEGKWTLKVPVEPAGASGGMGRSELSWKGPSGRVPDEAVSESGAAGELEPVVTMSAERRRIRLGDWGEIDDDLVSVISGPRIGLRFRQIELELLGPAADPETVGAVLDALRAAGARPGGGVKFAMAAGLE